MENLPIFEGDIFKPSLFKNNKNCYKHRDAYVFIDLKNKDHIIEQLFAHNPILFNDELADANDGVYSWILYSYQSSYMFACVNVRSEFELNTQHGNIVYSLRKNIDTLHLAGELMKMGNKIYFNFVSGTFMVSVFENQQYNSIDVARKFIKIMEFIMPSQKFTFSRTLNTFILESIIPLTPSELRFMVANGVNVYLVEDFEECQNLKNYDINHNRWEAEKNQAERSGQIFNKPEPRRKEELLRPFEFSKRKRSERSKRRII